MWAMLSFYEHKSGALLYGVLSFVFFFSMIAIPKINDLHPKALEGATKANLGAMRSALSIYKGDHANRFPTSTNALTNGSTIYLLEIPETKVFPYHQPNRGVADYSDVAEGKSWPELRDTGSWAYLNNPKSKFFGSLWVDCTHTDTKENLWASY